MVILTAIGGWSQNKFTQGAIEDYSVQLKTGEPNNAKYNWLVTPANGTSTNMSLFDGDISQIVWDGSAGFYTLSVEVVDGNGCLSESISQEVEITSLGDIIFASSHSNTIVCSDLAGGIDGTFSGHSQSLFRVANSNDINLLSVKITIQNPDGIYVGVDGIAMADQQNPNVTITNSESDSVIDFAISDSWENNTNQSVQFEIVMISALTTDLIEIMAADGNDVIRTISVLPKPVIEFQ